MKNLLILKISFFLFLTCSIIGCSKTTTDQDSKSETSVILGVNKINFLVGETINLTALTNQQTDVSSKSVFFINNEAIASNNYTFSTDGIFDIKATYNNLSSNVVKVTVQPVNTATNNYVHRVLIEEFSGTWCGNCPSILYGIQLLKQQTDKEVSVQIHLSGNDPFITSTGNSIASSQGVNGVPNGKINRFVNWNGPHYQNVNQVINEIKSSAPVGLALSPKIVSNNISVDIALGFANTNLSTKLIVYVVEDKLYHAQANYSSTLYSGQNPVSGFEYNGVLRAAITSISGETIVSSATVNKNYTLAIPSNISNTTNVKIVAFLIDNATNSVLNVREAVIGQNQTLEKL